MEITPTLIPRREMDNHVNMSCPLRPTECPFSGLGCMAPGLRALDVVDHLEECAVAHSLLMVERILELSQVVKSLNAKNKELEARLTAAEAGHNANLATAMKGMEVHFAELREKDKKAHLDASARMERNLLNRVSQISESGNSLSNRCDREFAKVAQALTNQKALIATLEARHTAQTAKAPKK